MRVVQLVQVNHAYGRNAFLPYSAGMVQASAQAVPEIAEAYEFLPIVYERKDVLELARSLPRLDVLALSCYIWNFEWSKAFARAVRSINRNCFIVMGGPQVPHHGDVIEADALVHFEGEKGFARVLLERLKPDPDYLTIPGVSLRGKEGPPAERIQDLNALPSPYLTGVFDGVMQDSRYDFHGSQETHRGCPFDCSFCDWGSSVFTKVRRLGRERVEAELKWFSDNKIDLLYNCDANFGLFKDDVQIASSMAVLKRDTGYPKKFRAAYAKNTGDTVAEIAKILHAAGMNKGVTLSFQSMDDGVLENVKRKNIKVNDFRKTIAMYARSGIATYSEIILGLPGETYASFANGLEELIDAGQHDSINVYPCIVLENSELNAPAEIEKYAIKTVRSPMPMFHAVPSADPHPEHYDLVISTKTMPRADWMKAQLFSWAVQTFHCFGLSSALAIVVKKLGVGYRRFYEGILNIPSGRIAAEVASAEKCFLDLRGGYRWDQVLEGFGGITWSPEEASFLRLSANVPSLMVELAQYAHSLVGSADHEVVDAVAYQEAVAPGPYQPAAVRLGAEFDVHAYVEGVRKLEVEPVLDLRPTRYLVTREPYSGACERFAKEVVWYGRKGGSKGVKVTRV